MELRLRAPLESLVGFETAPRTRNQRQAVKNLALRLHQPHWLFIPSAAARCSQTRVALASPAIEPALLSDAQEIPPAAAAAVVPAARRAAATHSDLDAAITFTCLAPQSLTGLQVKLFEAFPALLQIDVDIVTPRGQSGARLSPNRASLTW
jgi:hypothetical protein